MLPDNLDPTGWTVGRRLNQRPAELDQATTERAHEVTLDLTLSYADDALVRDLKKKKEREKELLGEVREGWGERERERERESTCVCVCVRACVFVCVHGSRGKRLSPHSSFPLSCTFMPADSTRIPKTEFR